MTVVRIGFIGPFGSTYNADYGSERQIGAIEYQLFGLAKGLSSLGHEVFITRNWKGNCKESLIHEVTFENTNSFSSIQQGFWDSCFPLNHISNAYYLTNAPRRIGSLNLDVINVSRVFSGWLALKQIRSNKSRCVYITHDNDIYFGGGLGHSRFPILAKNLLFSVNKNYDATVATTTGVQQYFRTLGLNCHAVISESIDPSLYVSKAEEGFILTAARLVPHKRIEDLIQAYSAICDKISERLIIIGSGPHGAYLKSFANSTHCKERISFIPFLPKSKYIEYLSKCSVFVLPSLSEAFGLVILDAMASGKPVIARRTIGPQDIVTDGYDGFLFENNREFAEKLLSLLLNRKLRNLMGTNARKTVDEKYTFGKAVERYLKLYERLLG
jgi:glycosyltransferase involved in cell wall biosynthesis